MDKYKMPAWCDGFIVLESGDTISGRIKQEGYARSAGTLIQSYYMTFASEKTCVMKFRPYGLRCFQYLPTDGPWPGDTNQIKAQKMWSQTYGYPYNDHAPYDYYVILPNNVDGDNPEGQIFAQELRRGRCSVYGFEEHIVYQVYGIGANGTSMGEGVRYENKCFLRKANEGTVIVQQKTFEKEMKTFFSDCPTIVSRIESGQYSYKNWPEMVAFYNESCH